MHIRSDIQNRFPLSPKKPLKKTLSVVLVLILVFFPLLSLRFVFEANTNYMFFIGYLAGFIALSMLIYYYQLWYYKHYFYDITEDYVIVKKGPLAPQEITIPYGRINDIYLDQDVLDRLFGLYDIHIATATTTSQMRAHIDGVEREAAIGLRDLILKKIKENTKK